MKARFAGPLGNLIKRHLELRRSLGYELRTAEIALDQFDAYAADSFPDCQTVTRPMITGYLQKISDLHPITRHQSVVGPSAILPLPVSTRSRELHP